MISKAKDTVPDIEILKTPLVTYYIFVDRDVTLHVRPLVTLLNE